MIFPLIKINFCNILCLIAVMQCWRSQCAGLGVWGSGKNWAVAAQCCGAQIRDVSSFCSPSNSWQWTIITSLGHTYTNTTQLEHTKTWRVHCTWLIMWQEHCPMWPRPPCPHVLCCHPATGHWSPGAASTHWRQGSHGMINDTRLWWMFPSKLVLAA